MSGPRRDRRHSGGAALVLAAALLTGQARSQAADGTYEGRMRCDALDEANWAAFNQPVTVTVTGSEIRYERRTLVPGTGGASSEHWERGRGTLGGDGAIRIETSGTTRVSKYTALWRGRQVGGEITLHGTQYWQIGRDSRQLERRCEIAVQLRR